MKLELGSGQRPTPGYVTSDLNPFDGIEIVGPAWEIAGYDAHFDEVIAIAFMEHLTYEQFGLTVANVRRMLKPGGVFLFDVPDLKAWARYLIEGHPDFDEAYILRTLYGWQRWKGDGHLSGWTAELVEQHVNDAGFEFCAVERVPVEFRSRQIYRYRFTRPEADAHLYVRCS